MHRLIRALSHVTALAGGIVLLVLIVLTTLSIIGRSAGLGEIQGNYELLEAGVAFAIFSFLPITQFYNSHATVDVFTARLSGRANRWIAAFWEVVLTLVILLIVLQLYGGLERYWRNGETTLFLQFPVWWAYAAAFAAGVVTCVVGLYVAVARVGEAVTGRAVLPDLHEGH